MRITQKTEINSGFFDDCSSLSLFHSCYDFQDLRKIRRQDRREGTAGSVWTIKSRKEENIGKGWVFDKKEEEEKARGERKGTQEQIRD